MKTIELADGQYFKQAIFGSGGAFITGRRISLRNMEIIAYFAQQLVWNYATTAECEPITFQEAIIIATQNYVNNPEPVEPITETTVKLHTLKTAQFALESGKLCRRLGLGVDNAILVFFDADNTHPTVPIKLSIKEFEVIPISLQQGLLHIIEQTCK